MPVRPTTDMAKEALFNILENRYVFSEISIVDLFSGTGNIAYEFISRGAKNVVAIDANIHCIKFISKTVKELDENIELKKIDVFHYLEKATWKADIIFADPPYDLPFEEFQKIVNLVFEKNLLELDGLLVIEHSPKTILSNFPQFIEKRKYGSSVFSLFQEIE